MLCLHAADKQVLSQDLTSKRWSTRTLASLSGMLVARTRYAVARQPRVYLVPGDDAGGALVAGVADSSSLEALLPEYSGTHICRG